MNVKSKKLYLRGCIIWYIRCVEKDEIIGLGNSSYRRLSVGREVNYKGVYGIYCGGGGDEIVLYFDYGVVI